MAHPSRDGGAIRRGPHPNHPTLSNIYKDGELDKSATCAESAQVQKEGTRTVVRQVPLYNLEAIISVGYCANSKRGIERPVVLYHLRTIYRNEELVEEATCTKIVQVQSEGGRTVKRERPIYNLDVILSVGYRVNSKRGIAFRR